MFGKMLNNYYYGKSGKGDYNKENLPRNRWQLFWEMLRVRFTGLFRLNIIAIAVFIPLLYVCAQMVNNLFTLMTVYVTVEQDMAAATQDMLNLYNNFGPAIQSVLNVSFLWMIPCIAITGPAQAGMAYVTRNWARDEHAFVWSDFKDAVRDNWKQALGVSVITGFVPFAMLLCWQFYGSLAGGSVLYIIPQIFALTLGLLWMLALTYMYPMLVTYDMKFGQIIKNGFLLAIGRLPHTVGARLVMLLPAALVLLVSFFTPYTLYALMFLGGYYLLLGNALARFVYASFTNGMFDKYINSRMEGVQVNRGLAEEEEDDDEDDHIDPPSKPRGFDGGTII